MITLPFLSLESKEKRRGEKKREAKREERRREKRREEKFLLVSFPAIKDNLLFVKHNRIIYSLVYYSLFGRIQYVCL